MMKRMLVSLSSSPGTVGVGARGDAGACPSPGGGPPQISSCSRRKPPN